MSKRTGLILLICSFCVGLYFCVSIVDVYSAYSNDSNVTNGYIALLIAFYIISFHFFSLPWRKGIDIFDPLFIFFIFDYMLLVVAPIIFILIQNIDCHGIYIMDGCVKGTVLHLIAYFSIMLGYFSKRKEPYPEDKRLCCYNSNDTFTIALLMWIVFFAISMLFLLLSGRSMTYILTLGLSGDISEATSDSSLKFLINVSYCLIPCWLYICATSKSKGTKFLVGLLTAIVFLIRGTRFIVVVMFLSYFVINHLILRKRPDKKKLLTLLVVFILFATVMGYSRTALRSGSELDLSNMNISSFWRMMETNFDLFKTYYGTLADVPQKVSYTYGEAIILDPIIYVIPRILWKGKPSASAMALLRSEITAVGYKVIVGAGMATVWLTEFYLDFGILGCTLLTFLLGRLMVSLRALVTRDKENLDNLIIYSVVYSAIMQCVIRGYMAMNVWMIFFLIFPVIAMRLLKSFKKE